jgi:prepilin-type N-terminal cleavage/methylation domain-containing protein
MKIVIASRPGFSLIELIIALFLVTIVTGTAMPAVARTIGNARLQRAAHLVAADLQLATTTAARRRAPVRMSVDTANRIVRIVDHAVPTTVYTERRYDSTSDYAVQRLEASRTTVVFFPNGLANDTIRFTLTASGRTQLVRMSRVGQIRFTQ